MRTDVERRGKPEDVNASLGFLAHAAANSGGGGGEEGNAPDGGEGGERLGGGECNRVSFMHVSSPDDADDEGLVCV